MKKLVIYSSKTGVTQQVAHVLNDTIAEDMVLINVKEAKTIDLERFDAVILGAATYASRLAGPMRNFVKQHAQVLQQKRLGLFLCGASDTPDIDAILKLSYPQEILDHATFAIHCGGEFRMDKLGFFSRTLIKMISKSEAKKGRTSNVELNQEHINALIEAVKEL